MPETKEIAVLQRPELLQLIEDGTDLIPASVDAIKDAGLTQDYAKIKQLLEFKVATHDAADEAAEHAIVAKKFLKVVTAYLDPIKDAMNTQKSKFMNFIYKPLTETPAEVEKYLKAEIGAFKKRIDQERAASEAKRLAEEAARAKEEEDLPSWEIPSLPATTTPAPPPPVKIAGFSFSEGQPKVAVNDLALFLAWVHGNVADRGHYVTPNTVALNGLAKTKGTQFNVPGCTVTRDNNAAIRL